VNARQGNWFVGEPHAGFGCRSAEEKARGEKKTGENTLPESLLAGQTKLGDDAHRNRSQGRERDLEVRPQRNRKSLTPPGRRTRRPRDCGRATQLVKGVKRDRTTKNQACKTPIRPNKEGKGSESLLIRTGGCSQRQPTASTYRTERKKRNIVGSETERHRCALEPRSGKELQGAS